MDWKEFSVEMLEENGFSFRNVKSFEESEAAKNELYQKTLEMELQLRRRLGKTLSEKQPELSVEAAILQEGMARFQNRYYFNEGAGMMLETLKRIFEKLDRHEI